MPTRPLPVARLASLVVLLLLVSGCSADNTPAPTDTPSVTQGPLNPELVPQGPIPVTAESAAAEAVRLADAIQALVNPATIVAVNDEPRLIPADDDIASYYGYYRQLSLADSVDPVVLAETISAVLAQSGWTVGDKAEDPDTSLTVWPMSGGPADAPWFLALGGGIVTDGHPALTFTIASPDIPG